MEFLRFLSYDTLSQWACERVISALKRKPDLVLCPASGNSPLLTYQLLADYAKQHRDLFKRLRVVQLDEFITPGLPKGRGEEYMEKYLIEPLKINSDRYLGFRSQSDPTREVRRFAEEFSEWGPVDLSLLGMGLNGHLGLVEPAKELSYTVHEATLAPSSREHHMVSNLEAKPNTGMTMGIGDMMLTKEVILIVNGKHKHKALKQLLTRRISTRFPASLLWLHGNAYCLADEEALTGK